MDFRAKKKPSQPSGEKRSFRDHLRLVKSPENSTSPADAASQKPPEASLKAAAAFAAVTAVAIALLIHFGVRPEPLPLPPPLQRFTTLDQVFRKLGMEKYLAEKKTLRANVERLLKEPEGESARPARNIAVYLFPDLLEADDFERNEALSLWNPEEQSIEHAPRTPESRLWYEQMRANIWNYENPERSAPKISPYAQQVIRIFDEMSQPGDK